MAEPERRNEWRGDFAAIWAACIHLLNEIQLGIYHKNKNLAALLFIDLSKAFDSVYIKLFLKKIKNLGIRGPALKLLKSFLTN